MIDSFNYVFSTYTHPSRHYHDIGHLYSMLNWAYLFGDPNQTREADGKILKRELYDAIMFHDYVYAMVPDVLSNEEKSARAYLEFVDTFKSANTSFATKVAGMIRATEHHFDGTDYDDYLTNLLLDIDLLAFTSLYDEFELTNEKIDREYIPTYGEKHTWRKRYAFLKNIHDGGLLRYRVIDADGGFAKAAYANMDRWLQENDHLAI
jgi:predicted metal-dependent HD superfamily phosphohydrolase